MRINLCFQINNATQKKISNKPDFYLFFHVINQVGSFTKEQTILTKPISSFFVLYLIPSANYTDYYKFNLPKHIIFLIINEYS